MLDARVRVGSIELPNPIMTASGTSGHGAELGAFFDLSLLGAVVVKSLAVFEWAGNPPPRLHPVRQGMLNSVGLQGPGAAAWIRHGLPELRAAGARIVVSIWGHTVEDFADAAALLAHQPGVVALELNLSCPNLSAGHTVFAHDPAATAAVVGVCASMGRPVWAKLSPNTDRIVDVARAAASAGADAVTLVNTLRAMALDRSSWRPAPGSGGGGLSGPAIGPVAVRAVHDVRLALPDVAIVGVGGVGCGWDAAELMLAGAQAVQVGTATFADPRAPKRVLTELLRWGEMAGLRTLAEATSAAGRASPPAQQRSPRPGERRDRVRAWLHPRRSARNSVPPPSPRPPRLDLPAPN